MSNGQRHDSLLLAQAQLEFNNKNWQACDITCEKIFFVTEDAQMTNSALFLKAMVLLNQNEFEQANEEIVKINYSIISVDSLKYIYKLNTALIAYLNNNYPEVNNAFNELKSEFPDSNGVFKDSFLDVFALNMQWRFTEADSLLHQYFTKYNNPQKADSLCLISQNMYKKSPKQKKIKTAKILALVPGLGHAYCGYYSEGLVSFGLNLAALTFTGGCVYYGMYLTSFFVGGSLLAQFTFGSFARAEKLVIKRNQFRVNSFNQTVTHFVMDNSGK